MKCHKCDYDYPEDLVRPMIVYGEHLAVVLMLCGVCALNAKNELHGTDDDHFTAPEAERIRLLAIEWRKNNVTHH